MEYRQLNNQVDIPTIGFGVWQTKGTETTQAVLDALDAGYRLIDTASRYGNEEAVGAALTHASVPRSEIFLTSKLWKEDYGYEQTLQAFATSLKKLQVTELDLYLLHWPIEDTKNLLDAWRAVEELYDQKKIRAIGVSNFNKAQLEYLIAHSRIKPMVNQIELHPTHAQEATLQDMSDLGILVEAYSPLGHSADLDHPVIQELAAHYSKSPAQIILRWEIQKGIVPLPKSVTPERIKENIAVFDFALTPEAIEQIDQLDTENRINKNPDDIVLH
ncbi:MAG: aldo/keto reductase [Enterococcus sp.]